MNEPRDSQFADTKVLIYAHNFPVGDKHTSSLELIERPWDSQLGCLSLQVPQVF
jgi:hypothetical protein